MMNEEFKRLYLAVRELSAAIASIIQKDLAETAMISRKSS